MKIKPINSHTIRLRQFDLAKTATYIDGFKYELDTPYSIRVPIAIESTVQSSSDKIVLFPHDDGNSTLTLVPGFKWNGADYYPDTHGALRPSAVHDALLTLLGEGLLGTRNKEATKLIIDYIFREVYYHDLLVAANKASLWDIKTQWICRIDRKGTANRAFYAVQKMGSPDGMAPINHRHTMP